MNYYTHATIIHPQCLIRRERLLPQIGELTVSTGQEVSSVQVVGRTQQAQEFELLPASELLSITPERLPDYLLVQEGSQIEVGDVLARKRELLRSRKVISPLEGVVYAVANGRLVLQRLPLWHELRALMRGRIIGHIAQRGVIIETRGALVQGVWGSGKEGFGRLVVVGDTANAVATASQLSHNLANQVVTVGQVTQAEVLHKAEDLNLHGLIMGSMPAELITVAASLSFPVIVTDGMGAQGMALPAFQLLQKLAGQMATLFALAPNERGHRPEIIIPNSGPATYESLELPQPLQEGQTVRILRAPYYQAMGTVVRLYSQAQTITTSTQTQGAGVKLADGQIIFVPYANLDLIR